LSVVGGTSPVGPTLT